MRCTMLASICVLTAVSLLSAGCGGLETPPPATVTRVPSSTPTIEVLGQQVDPTAPATSVPPAVAQTPTNAPVVSATAVATALPTSTPSPLPATTSMAAPEEALVREGPLNARSGPGRAYPRVGQLEEGTIVEIVGRNPESTWWQILLEAGTDTEAWVSAEFIQVNEPVEVEVSEASTIPATSSPAFAGKIVFQEASGSRIFVIGASGTGLQQLGEGLDPALSPDGTVVAFVRWRSPAGIYLINTDGTGERLLTEVEQAKSPEWSPDGERIAFSHRSGGGFDYFWDSENRTMIKREDPHWKLGVADVSTGAFFDVHSEDHSFSPSWSSDGWWLVYDGEKGLMLTDATGESTRWQQVTYLVRDMSPDWAPEPRGDAWAAPVAYMVFHNDHWEVHTVLPGGQGGSRLTPSPMFQAPQNSVAPDWSPDGRWIAFLTDRRGTWEIWVMRADGSQQQPMFAPGVLEGIEFHYEAQSEQVLDWGI